MTDLLQAHFGPLPNPHQETLVNVVEAPVERYYLVSNAAFTMAAEEINYDQVQEELIDTNEKRVPGSTGVIRWNRNDTTEEFLEKVTARAKQIPFLKNVKLMFFQGASQTDTYGRYYVNRVAINNLQRWYKNIVTRDFFGDNLLPGIVYYIASGSQGPDLDILQDYLDLRGYTDKDIKVLQIVKVLLSEHSDKPGVNDFIERIGGKIQELTL